MARIGEVQAPAATRDALARGRLRASLVPDLLVEARRIVNTVIAGWHGRRKRGIGENFWQFRPYVEGDSSRIDWRRSARDDHTYVRDREWEAAHTVWLWADPSPSMLYTQVGAGNIDRQIYRSLDSFAEDTVAAYRAEIADLYAAGCRYLQLDDVSLACLCDESMREQGRQRGDDPDAQLALSVKMVQGVLRDQPRDLTVCTHLCRGNFRSSWRAQGGYERVAETIFNQMPYDGFFLEFDDARSGDFSPLRHVPKGVRVVLGLVTSKSGTLERKDDLKRRLDEASKYVPLEQLCVSPQCGFSSTVEGNVVGGEQQRAKLALCVELAHEVWGGL